MLSPVFSGVFAFPSCSFPLVLGTAVAELKTPFGEVRELSRVPSLDFTRSADPEETSVASNGDDATTQVQIVKLDRHKTKQQQKSEGEYKNDAKTSQPPPYF